jgi:hypothetical protein
MGHSKGTVGQVVWFKYDLRMNSALLRFCIEIKKLKIYIMPPNVTPSPELSD